MSTLIFALIYTPLFPHVAKEIAYLMRPDERHAFPEFAALKRKSALPTPPPPPPPPAGGSNPEEELEEEEGDGEGSVVAGKVTRVYGEGEGPLLREAGGGF